MSSHRQEARVNVCVESMPTYHLRPDIQPRPVWLSLCLSILRTVLICVLYCINNFASKKNFPPHPKWLSTSTEKYMTKEADSGRWFGSFLRGSLDFVFASKENRHDFWTKSNAINEWRGRHLCGTGTDKVSCCLTRANRPWSTLENDRLTPRWDDRDREEGEGKWIAPPFMLIIR